MQEKRYTQKMFAVRGNQSAISNYRYKITSDQEQQEHDESLESRDSNPRGPFAGNAEQRNGHGPVAKFNGRNAHDQWCKHCNVAIENRVQYWHHKRMHMDPSRVKACPTCDYVTHQKALLEQHMAFHSTVKPFVCPRCDYRCVDKSMLKSHFKKHLDVYLYWCDVCPYRSKYNNSWHAHLKSKKHYLSTMVAAAQRRQQNSRRRRRQPVQTAALQQPDRAGPSRAVATTVVPAAVPVTLQSLSSFSVQTPPPQPPPPTPTPTGSSRRKGVALKLWRSATVDGHRELDTGTAPPTTTRAAISHNDGEINQLACNVCDVEFAENVLYVKHMGYHSFGEPLTCNLCGEVMNDTPSFLSHVTRVPVHD